MDNSERFMEQPQGQTISNIYQGFHFQDTCDLLALRGLEQETGVNIVNDQTTLHKKYKNPSTFYPIQSRGNTIETFYRRVEADLRTLNHTKKPVKSNLNIHEQQALRSLSDNMNIVIKQADKGCSVVVMNRSSYIAEALRQLEDTSSYTKLRGDPTNVFQRQLMHLLDGALEEGFIDNDTCQYLYVKHPVIPIFHHLPKVHKTIENVQGRPIVSGIGSMLEHLSEWLDDLLQPLVIALRSYIRDTKHVLNMIDQIEWTRDSVWLTVDVTALYSSIPHHLGLKAIEYFLIHETTHNDLLFVWDSERYSVDEFVKYLGQNDFNLRFTHETNKQRIHYLDVELRGWQSVIIPALNMEQFCLNGHNPNPKSVILCTIQKPVVTLSFLHLQEFCVNPTFIESGAATTDICQGDLGDCWLLSSISSLTRSPALLSRVVPQGQSFCRTDGYCGIFHFMLWRFGSWVDVVVDDRLPTKKGRLVYTKSDTRGEMWSALLEKAYAKVCGGYLALQGGTIADALEDFTGGIAECVSLKGHSAEEAWDMVSQSENGTVLMACYIQAPSPSEVGYVNDDGLVLGHAYSVIGANKVTSSSGEVSLLRLRNPWGFTEYKGPWSDRSSEWASVLHNDQKLNLLKEDGEFWMSIEEFCRIFSWLVLCRVNLDSAQWSVTNLRGCWEKGVSAGGGRRLKSFFNNPQFRLRLNGESTSDEDPEEDEDLVQKPQQVLIQLFQLDRQMKRAHIACHLYRVPEELVSRPRMDRGFFTRNRPVRDSGDSQNSRSVTIRASLLPGVYVIIPSTHDPNEEGEFYIRVCKNSGSEIGSPV
ncbi:calpain-1 catalytic subunit-like [Bombina bombina]|uniref:calpain-1 catalytic subunit-like n=1 Tax=Bombina bombina TaxID=8345 RepID=UPI00235B0222|nr:calpain-1 catalytic subunit-like [Bombina bombina]